MNDTIPRPLARRTPLVLAALMVIAIVGFALVSRLGVLAALMVIAIVGFALVSRLVIRLKANEKQIAWHAYEAGRTKGNYERAVPEVSLPSY